MLVWLTPLFGSVAVLYASVGFAGGSTYTALLVLSGADVAVIPLISLSCNIIVATGGVWHFARNGLIPWRRAVPLLALSVPLAWYGGRLPIESWLIAELLGWSLVVAGLLLIVSPARAATGQYSRKTQLTAIVTAGPLGLLSGIVGIGGGIFLAPVLHLLRWDDSRRVAGCAALFILINSLAGFAGQLEKIGSSALREQAMAWWPLAVAVLIGGQLGSLVGSGKLPAPLIRRLTGIVVLIAAVRLLTL